MNLYDLTIPVFDRYLGNLSAFLDRGEAYSTEQGIDPADMTGARLASDMYPLTSQIHVATDSAKGCAYRLAGQDVPRWADTETTFEELRGRIAKTRRLLGEFDASMFAGAEDKIITMRFASRELRFSGLDYVNNLALPNFYFHVSLAYGILRSQGVSLGKFDYLGDF